MNSSDITRISIDSSSLPFERINHLGGELDETAIKLMEKAIPNNIYIFEEIKVLCPGYRRPIKVAPLVFRIRGQDMYGEDR